MLEILPDEAGLHRGSLRMAVGAMFTLTSISDSIGVSTWSNLSLKLEESVVWDSLRMAELSGVRRRFVT